MMIVPFLLIVPLMSSRTALVSYFQSMSLSPIDEDLVVSIPVLMLWHVRIPLQKKLILIGIFSITVVVMIVSIIRVAVVYSYTHTADISWLYLWSSIEMATSKRE